MTIRRCQVVTMAFALEVASPVISADGYGARAAAVWMARALPGALQSTLGADEGCDTSDLVADPLILMITPHLTQTIHTRRRSAIDVRTVRYSGYGPSIDAIRRIEKVFGWIKQAAWLSQLKPRWRSRVGAALRLHVAAYNLIRLVNLLSLRDALACTGSGELRGDHRRTCDSKAIRHRGPVPQQQRKPHGCRGPWPTRLNTGRQAAMSRHFQFVQGRDLGSSWRPCFAQPVVCLSVL